MPDEPNPISEITGLSTEELKSIFSEVKANRAKLHSCKAHKFPGGPILKLGDKYTCLNCGGTENLDRISSYLEGYRAAGGNADDVWPGWK